MLRISQDDFKKRYGENALDDFTAPPQTVGKVGMIRDIPSDIVETGKGVWNAAKGTAEKLKESVTTPGLSLTQRAVGALVAPAQGAVQTASALATGAGKLLTTDEFENDINTKIGEVGAGVVGSDFGKKVAGIYDKLPDDQKYTFTNIIGPIAETMATVGTGGVSGSATKTFIDAIKRGLAKTATQTPSLGSIPQIIKGAGSALYKTAITPNVDEAKAILRYRANTPFLTRLQNMDANAPMTRSQTALEKGIAGTESMIGVQARKEADKLWNKEIAPLVAKSDVQMTKDELFTPALERILAIEDPTRRKAMEDAFEALVDDYKAYPEAFGLEQAQKLKRDIAKFTPTKIFKGKDVANEMRTIQADMASAIRQKTYDSFPDENIKKMYLDWANLDELEGLGIKAISEASFKAGSGTLLSGIWDMATTPIKSVGGQMLYRAGNALEFTAPKGTKTVGEYLESLGYTKPIPVPVSPGELQQE